MCACACAWAYAVVCKRHRACLCMRAREPTACMIWRMQTRAYVDVGPGVGVVVGEMVLKEEVYFSTIPDAGEAGGVSPPNV